MRCMGLKFQTETRRSCGWVATCALKNDKSWAKACNVDKLHTPTPERCRAGGQISMRTTHDSTKREIRFCAQLQKILALRSWVSGDATGPLRF